MLEDLQILHYSPTTIRFYLHSIAEFAYHFRKPQDEFPGARDKPFLRGRQGPGREGGRAQPEEVVPHAF
jgi:hypothetical protein